MSTEKLSDLLANEQIIRVVDKFLPRGWLGQFKSLRWATELLVMLHKRATCRVGRATRRRCPETSEQLRMEDET